MAAVPLAVVPEVSRARPQPPPEDLVSLARAVRSGGPLELPSTAVPSTALPRTTRRGFLGGGAAVLAAALAACGRTSPVSSSGGSTGSAGALSIGAIPDQDPQVLQRLYGTVADSMSATLDLDVSYRPVTDYGAAVSLFRTGDLDLVWFGGLTGVQARLQTPGAEPVAQRDIDADFHSVFVVNTATGLAPSDDLTPLAPLRFSYGSETSTSGRLMPAWFLQQQGVDPQGFPGGPGFSGSHDATLALVAAGTYQAGVLNEQVWTSRTAEGSVDPAVVQYARTPGYHDYHWLLGPGAAERLGDDLGDRLRGYLTGLPAGDEVLELFGAGSFVATEAANYDQIEEIGRQLGLVS